MPRCDYTLCLPLHQSLTDTEVAFVIESVRKFGEG